MSTALAVFEPSQVGEARRLASAAARAAAFPPTGIARVELVASEMATNLVKHAREGMIVIRTLDGAGMHGVELVALDRGPGIDRPDESCQDGVSTVGTLGGGLGTIGRLSDEWDLHSTVGLGTVVFSRLWREVTEPVVVPAFHAAGIALPAPWERACGDAWAEAHRPHEAAILVVDGLGHGEAAAKAAALAVDTFRDQPWLAPVDQLRSLNSALSRTRGAAAAVARLDARAERVTFAGVGNVAGLVVGPAGARHTLSSHGIIGHRLPRVSEFGCDLGPGCLLIMHTDGVSGRFDLGSYAGLARSDPLLVAASLLRDFRRPADDACMVVSRRASDVGER